MLYIYIHVYILFFSLHYQIILGYLLGKQKTLRWSKKKCDSSCQDCSFIQSLQFLIARGFEGAGRKSKVFSFQLIKVLESVRTVIFIIKNLVYYSAFILTNILLKRSRIIHTYHILSLQNYKIIINFFYPEPNLIPRAVINVTSFFGYYLKTAHHRYKYLHQNMPTQNMLFLHMDYFALKAVKKQQMQGNF